ncbi:MAG: hypothetical protein ACF8OB_07315 [Phycisphaeraceae bacterium JB051]
MHLFKIPDEQYIHHIRKKHKRRIWTALLMFLSAGLFYVFMEGYLLPYLSLGFHFDRIDIENSVPLFSPDDPDLLKTKYFLYTYGFLSGIAAKSMGLITAVLIICGVNLLCTHDRKTKMLLQLWDEKHRGKTSSNEKPLKV